jgi:hypothetical protein
MGESTDQITRHIEEKKEDLRSNLRELEDRVKSAVDWRRHFRRNPAVGLGVGVAGGLLLAGLIGGSGQRRPRVRSPAHAARPAARNEGRGARGQILHAWENLTSALIGIVSAKLTDSLGHAARGFVDHIVGNGSAGTTEPRSSGNGVQGEGNGVQGEGDYRAARRYRAAAERFAHTADIRRAARSAAPRNEAEAEEMAEAEAEGSARAKPS